MILGASDLALLRSRPHLSNLYLSIFQPKTVMACQVNNASGTRGDRTIYYDGVTTGSYTSIEADMTMLVGSAAGASDIGRIRVRSAGTGSFLVAENADIQWADNLYLTILDYIDVAPIFQRIVETGGGSTVDMIIYKDYDIEYTNQNSVLGTFVNAGPHRAVFREAGTAQVYYSASGTYNVNSSTLTYYWAFDGGTPSTYNGPVPGYVSYNAAGHYRTRLIVSGSAGESDVTYRYLSVYDRPNEGSFLPIIEFELSQLEGNRASNGYTANISVHQILPTLQAGALVVIFADDWYGNTKISLGGNTLNNSQILFVGYVSKDTIYYDFQTSRTEFTVESITSLIKTLDTFAMNFESKVTPKTWFQVADMTLPKAIYAYLRWQSTLLKTTDLVYAADNRGVKTFDADQVSIFDAIYSFIHGCIDGNVVSDRQGRIWIETDPEGKHSGLTTTPISMTLDRQDWLSEPSIEERVGKELAHLSIGGFAYSGVVTGTLVPVLSDAPGTAPSYQGTSDDVQGFAVVSQGQLNQLAGDIFAYRNSKYVNLSIMLAGNYRNLDIAPLEACKINIAAEDTVRGIVMTNKQFYLTSLAWEFNPEEGVLMASSAGFNEVTEGVDGQTEPIPPTPPDDGYVPPPVVIPPITVPSFSPIKTYTWILGDVAVDNIPGPYMIYPQVIISIDAGRVGATGTSFSFNVEDRPVWGVSGTDVSSSEINCAGVSHNMSFAAPNLFSGHWMWLDISAVSGTITRAAITVTTRMI